MKLCRVGFGMASLAFLAGCLNSNVRIEYVPVVPVVAAELRSPVVLPDRELSGLASVGVILADNVEGLQQANGRIIAIDCILSAAEQGVEPDCGLPE